MFDMNLVCVANINGYMIDGDVGQGLYNATRLCGAYGRKFKRFTQNINNQRYITELCERLGCSVDDVIRRKGPHGHTYVTAEVLVRLADWIDRSGMISRSLMAYLALKPVVTPPAAVTTNVFEVNTTSDHELLTACLKSLEELKKDVAALAASVKKPTHNEKRSVPRNKMPRLKADVQIQIDSKRWNEPREPNATWGGEVLVTTMLDPRTLDPLQKDPYTGVVKRYIEDEMPYWFGVDGVPMPQQIIYHRIYRLFEIATGVNLDEKLAHYCRFLKISSDSPRKPSKIKMIKAAGLSKLLALILFEVCGKGQFPVYVDDATLENYTPAKLNVHLPNWWYGVDDKTADEKATSRLTEAGKSLEDYKSKPKLASELDEEDAFTTPGCTGAEIQAIMQEAATPRQDNAWCDKQKELQKQ